MKIPCSPAGAGFPRRSNKLRGFFICVALVTGVSKGIGRSIARMLTAEGLKVVGCARRLDRLEALSQKISEAGGVFKGVHADVRRENELLEMFNEMRASWGGVDVLVNNAGFGCYAPLPEGR
jgi:NADP-dependent 3-hydroxy acid dehydrogenase YdfG